MDSNSANIAANIAQNSFENGHLCAESVVIAISTVQKLESDCLPKIATAFCSGMARTCGTCGALTGAMMGLSLSLGRDDKHASVEPVYQATQRLINQFETQFGAKECHLLLGCDIGTKEGQQQFKQNNLQLQCQKYTRKAAEIAVTILVDNES